MPIKKKKVKAPVKKPKAKPRAKPKSKADEILKAYQAGIKAGIPAYGSIPRTGGNYAVAQGLPQQVFASAGSVPLGSNINEKLLSAYNALVWTRQPPSKEEFINFPADTQDAYVDSIENILGKEAAIQFKEEMGRKQNPSDISPLFQAPSQRGGFDLQSARSFNEVLSEVVDREIYDDPTTNSVFSGSSFTNVPSRFPKQTSDIFDINQMEKQDNALSNIARQTQENIQVSQVLENQAYPEIQGGKKPINIPVAKPKGRPRKKKTEVVASEGSLSE